MLRLSGLLIHAHIYFTMFNIWYKIHNLIPCYLPDRFSGLEVTLNATEFNMFLIPWHFMCITVWFFLQHWKIHHVSTLEYISPIVVLQIFNEHLQCGHTDLALNKIYKDLCSQKAYILAASGMEFITHRLFYFIYSISNYCVPLCVRNSSWSGGTKDE